METKKHTKLKKVLLIVAIVLVALLCVGSVVGGKVLFDFALNPNASFTMQDLLYRGSDVIGQQPDAPISEDTAAWRAYSQEAGEWFAREGQAVSITREDQSVRRGTLLAREGHAYAITCHGYTGNSTQMAAYAGMFYEMGMSVLAPDALAHGESDGAYIGMGWLERGDILAWIDFILLRDPQAEIMLFGVSMGGATVMMAAGEDLPPQVKCVVEDCGYSSVWDEFSIQLKNVFGLPSFPLLNMASLVCELQAGYNFRQASAAEQLKNATVPMLFIHGEEDTFVPYAMLDVVFQACASQVKERLSVPGAIHGAAADTDPVTYWTTVESFVGRFMELDPAA